MILVKEMLEKITKQEEVRNIFPLDFDRFLSNNFCEERKFIQLFASGEVNQELQKKW